MARIHQDLFTVGSDVNLGAHGNWQVTLGAAGDNIVESTTDRAEVVTLNTDSLYRWNGAGTPTSGLILAYMQPQNSGGGNYGACSLWARCDASGNGYNAFFNSNSGIIELYRVTGNGTVFTLLDSGGTITGGTIYRGWFSVVGTGATVSLAVGEGDVGLLANFDDSNAARHTAGLFGISVYSTVSTHANGGASPAWVDNAEIYDRAFPFDEDFNFADGSGPLRAAGIGGGGPIWNTFTSGIAAHRQSGGNLAQEVDGTNAWSYLNVDGFDTYPTNQRVEAVIGSAEAFCGVMFRTSDVTVIGPSPTAGYRLTVDFGADLLELVEFTGGTEGAITTRSTPGIAAGDSFGVIVIGNQIQILWNGVPQGALVTNNAHSSGEVGFVTSDQTTNLLNSWSASAASAFIDVGYPAGGGGLVVGSFLSWVGASYVGADDNAGNQTVLPSPVVLALTVTTPTLVAGAVTLTPSPVVAAFTTTTPTLVAGAVTLTPASVVAAFTTTTPTLVAGAVTLTPASVVAAFTATTPTVLNGFTISPSPVVAVFATTTPTLIIGTVTLTPSPVVAVFATTTPTLVAGVVTLTPSPVVASFTTTTPTLIIGTVTLTPSPVVAVFATTTPTLIIGTVTLTPASVVATFTATTPTLVVGAVTLTPSPVVAVFSATTPTILTGGTVGPSPVVAAFTTTTPTLVAGAVTLTPASVVAAFTATTPTVLIGGRTVTPASVVAVFTTTTPSVTFTDITLTPASVVANFAATAPSLLVGARTLAPAPAVATFGVFTPIVVIPFIIEAKELLADGTTVERTGTSDTIERLAEGGSPGMSAH